ncbi:hypothetical protein [Clostridium gasigenes]|uniref:hypothetical protein n=1 Tax=Clostridium gasigenes TaxID=94869 RepID=UPI001C0B51FC|nr:hypothetical protein [Clostridium gasigenes]MBU3105681.1 hypothetical protein [Clostridium gasigenes]
MKLVNISDNKSNKVNVGILCIHIIVGCLKVVATVGVVAEVVNFAGSAYNSFNNGYESL